MPGWASERHHHPLPLFREHHPYSGTGDSVASFVIDSRHLSLELLRERSLSAGLNEGFLMELRP